MIVAIHALTDIDEIVNCAEVITAMGEVEGFTLHEVDELINAPVP